MYISHHREASADMTRITGFDTFDVRFPTSRTLAGSDAMNALTPDEALALLERGAPGRDERIATLRRDGYPAYSTGPGWLGYSDERLAALCEQAVAEGFSQVKIKVGAGRTVNVLLGPSPLVLARPLSAGCTSRSAKRRRHIRSRPRGPTAPPPYCLPEPDR